MRLTTYHGCYAVTCTSCGATCNGYREHVYADLDGEPFKAYIHAKCLTPEQTAEGLAKAEAFRFESMATDFDTNRNRYAGE